MAKRVLIVDDDPGIQSAVSLLLEESDYLPVAVASGQAALERLALEEAQVVLCDVAMPGMNGIELVERLQSEHPDLPVIMISGHGDLETAVAAVRAGAYDYLVKPIDEKRLLLTLERALEHRRLRSDNQALRQEARDDLILLGESAPMEHLRKEIARAAPSEARILVLGENGTGKELVAKLLHEKSRRKDRPFIKLNSAAIPKDLIESELFGHEAGAFTGATRPKKGKLELADGGTLFLDEISDMEPEPQAKLLRVLSTGELERVGGTKVIPFDVRLISASNRDLLMEIKAGRFREDLYHRIAVIPIRVPALRERGRDVEILAAHFLAQFARDQGRPVPLLSPPARSLLRRYLWPGNVRELRNLAERISIMLPAAEVTEAALEELLSPSALHPAAPSNAEASREAEDATPQWKARLREEERTLVEQSLREAGWNVTLAAERLGLDRASLHRKMRRLGIHRPGRA